MNKIRVVAAMSGGVDSAVAAGLLVEAGYEVVGVTMKMYEATRPAHAKSCCGNDDFDDARRSAARLNIPHFVLDYTTEFTRGVKDRFVEAYRSGRTPNPCVACNNFVKLGSLRRYAASIGARFLATGHYARLRHDDDGPHLYRTTHTKDQAYALSGLRAEQLSGLFLPLGELDKAATRDHARRLGLDVHDKTESQDICFIEGGDYRDAVHDAGPGEMRERDGSFVGTHAGVAQFTVGQRARIGGGVQARYVTKIDAASNTIFLGGLEDLDAHGLRASALNAIRPERLLETTRITVMIRSHAQPAAASLKVENDTGNVVVTFDQPQRAVTPGQLAAFFDPADGEVLGSATIEEPLLAA